MAISFFYLVWYNNHSYVRGIKRERYKTMIKDQIRNIIINEVVKKIGRASCRERVLRLV